MPETVPMPPLEEKHLARFWSRVAKTDECWMWTGAKNSSGYGEFRIGYEMARAHRVSWVLASGPIPPNTCVLHRCDVRPCVRPAHLFLGTPADNMADMISKGRKVAVCGEDHYGSKLTEASVREIRRRYTSTGTSQRALAAEYGVSQSLVSLVVLGKVWKHITNTVETTGGSDE